MISLRTDDFDHVSVSVLDGHQYLCDLIYVDGPLLSLFRDRKADWMYLWVDTDVYSINRWLLFEISRANLVGYLEKRISLLTLITESSSRYLMDSYQQERQRKGGKKVPVTLRSLYTVNSIDAIVEYLPDADSLFDDELAPDIALSRGFLPCHFDVPIAGNWFVSDLNKFGRVYGQLYSYFYCTQSRFITNIASRLGENLHSSWRGGGNRVKLFDDLRKYIPAIHDLKLEKMAYASPGEFRIEALESVGQNIADVVLLYVKERALVHETASKLNRLLDGAKLKRRDLSKYSDVNLPVDSSFISDMTKSVEILVQKLGISEQHAALCRESPNIVVSTKVLLALVKRIDYLSDLQRSGLITYH